MAFLLEWAHNVRENIVSFREYPSAPERTNTFFLGCLFIAASVVCRGSTAEESRIILRMDDSGFGRHSSEADESFLSDAEITRRVVEIVAKHGAKVSIGVIPNVVSGSPGYRPKTPVYAPLSSCNQEIEVLKAGILAGHVEIAMHGYTHEVMTIHDRHGSEFGGRPFDEQLRRLSLGKKEIEHSLGMIVDVFIPPFNNHDSETLRALDVLGIKTISSVAKHGDNLDSLFYVPVTTSLKELMEEPTKSLVADDLVLINVLFHVYDFLEGGSESAWLSLDDFDMFLADLTVQSGISFTTITDEVRRHEDDFGSDGSRFYAEYRNRVGRVANLSGLLGPAGNGLDLYLPSVNLLPSHDSMRRVIRRMLLLESLVNALCIGVVWAIVEKALKRARNHRRLGAWVGSILIGSGLCLVFLILEGVFGIAGPPGFGARLSIAISFTLAALCAAGRFWSANRAASPETVGREPGMGVGI